MQNIVTSRPFAKIAADQTELPLTCRGNRYVLVVMDYFTKYLNLYALPDQRTNTVAKCLFITSAATVCHKVCTLTNQFNSNLVKELCSRLVIYKTSHAMADGMVEQANRTVKDQLAKYLYTRGGEWDDHL